MCCVRQNSFSVFDKLGNCLAKIIYWTNERKTVSVILRFYIDRYSTVRDGRKEEGNVFF